MRPVLILTFLGIALAPHIAAAETRFGEFRDWLVGCDNRNDCRAVGWGSRNGDAIGSLGIDRAADADAAPRLWFSLDSAGSERFADGAVVAVSSDNAPLGRLVVGTSLVASDDERVRFHLRDDAVRPAVLEALRRGSRLSLAVEGSAQIFEISLDGAAAALLFMDDRQQRVGTVTALVRRGDRPAAAIPAPPEIAPEPQTRVDPHWPPVPASLPDPVAQRAVQSDDTCDIDEEARSQAEAIERLSAELVLVQGPCLRGAYNFSSRFFLWNERTGEITAPAFPVPQGVEGGLGPDVLTNSTFDSETLTITHFSKGRGLGDCGSAGAWRWDGQAFRLIRYSLMTQCHGLLSEDWIVLHRSQ